MNLKRYYVAMLIMLCFIFNSIPAQDVKAESELVKKLKALPGIVEVKEARFDSKLFTEAYEVMIEQPVDHTQPNGEKFQQRFFLSHKDYTSPVMLETEGYNLYGNRAMELTKILGGNQIYVEHRFFGRSCPKSMDWSKLTVKNAADDMHHIVTTLKQLYTGKWVASGTSKGGETTCFFKTFYPNDVDVSVPYVAPINVAQDDPRIYVHLDNVGDAECRKKISDYQIAMLQREDEMLPLVKEGVEKRKYTFTRCTFEEAYEMGLMEYEFTFWQNGPAKCSDIPAPDAPKEVMVEHYFKVNGIDFFTDLSIKGFEPYFYQAYTEIGSYNYDITNMKPYLKYAKNPSLIFMCPQGVPIVYHPETLQKVYHFLQYEANNMIFIYGGWDTWSSSGIQLIGRTNSIKLVKKEGYHGSRILQLSPEQKELFYNTLEKWLDIKVNRL
jgi:hypothetical protein